MIKYGNPFDEGLGKTISISGVCKKLNGQIMSIDMEQGGVVTQKVSAVLWDKAHEKIVTDYDTEYYIFKALLEEGLEPLGITKDTLEFFLSKRERVSAVKEMYNNAVLNAPLDTPISELEDIEDKYQLYSKVLNNIYRLAKG